MLNMIFQKIFVIYSLIPPLSIDSLSNIIDIRISIINTADSADPYPQSPVEVNCLSITLPIILTFQPPNSVETSNVDITGTNTIVIPDKIPGIDIGNITFQNVCILFAPKS